MEAITPIQTNLIAPIVIEFSKKQIEFQSHCYKNPLLDHRYYGKTGATRSGKTTLDFMWTIPFRLSARRGLKGLCGITGVSLGTIGRNVLEPMRNYWTSIGMKHVISDTKKDREGNTFVYVFGQKVYLIGMEKVTAVNKLRGLEFKYVYCDELAECNEDAFTLLKSRLSLAYSTCDFTCNPGADTHWLYRFIHSDVDIYLQEYTIFDNPFLAKQVVDALCKEYAGTVYYDRYILGLWKRAEGLIYTTFADNKQVYILDVAPRVDMIILGVDFGGNKSAHTFVATGYPRGLDYAVHLESERVDAKGITPTQLEEAFEKFYKMVAIKYGIKSMICYCDSAEQTLINGIKNRVISKGLAIEVKNALKRPINDRIHFQIELLGLRKLFFMQQASTCINAYSTAVYNGQKGHEDERLDDGTSDIDTMDASEYTLEPMMNMMMQLIESKRR